MLQPLLSEFLKVNGVHQATMIDDRGKLMSSVAAQGQLPHTQQAVELTVAALDVAQGYHLGDLREVWMEGEGLALVDILTPYRIVMLSGNGGNIARWRHAMDHMRPQLATTQEL